MSSLRTYLPQDRLRALVRGEMLPDRTTGSALFADISGFTPLTEVLHDALGPRRGAEELTRHLDAVYTALIAEVERFGGSVVGFAGDAITCWLDESVVSGPSPRGYPVVGCPWSVATGDGPRTTDHGQIVGSPRCHTFSASSSVVISSRRRLDAAVWRASIARTTRF